MFEWIALIDRCARYTPQAPTALSNGPTIIEAQVDTIVDMIKKLESEKARSIEPKQEAEAEWKQICHTMMQYTLIPYTNRSVIMNSLPADSAN